MGVRGVRRLWNCVAMEQSGYIREWQNLLLTLSSWSDNKKRMVISKILPLFIFEFRIISSKISEMESNEARYVQKTPTKNLQV